MTHSTLAPVGISRVPRLPSRKLAVWLFLGSEILFFSALIFSYIALRVTSADWPTHEQISHVLAINLTALNTFVLIVSSVTVVLALEAAKAGNRRQLLTFLGLTLVLGSIFLGIQMVEYRKLIHEGLTIRRTPIEGTSPFFAMTFFTMTGFHGMHVFGGVLTLSIVIVQALRGAYTPQNHLGVELFGLYWHFVDVVWIILFTIAYLI